MSTSAAPCPSCGEKEFHVEYMGEIGNRMKTSGRCFMCEFWEECCEKPQKVVIDNCVYGIGREPRPGENRRWLGMAGRRFDIEFFDGRKITTHNLWSGGVIPEKYRDRIPNTAKFIGGERCQVGETTCWNPADERAPSYPEYKDAP